MIGTWSVGNEKALVAYDHYKQFKGVSIDSSFVIGDNGEIVDNYGNFVMDLPIDPILFTLEEIVNYVISEDDRYEHYED